MVYVANVLNEIVEECEEHENCLDCSFLNADGECGFKRSPNKWDVPAIVENLD